MKSRIFQFNTLLVSFGLIVSILAASPSKESPNVSPPHNPTQNNTIANTASPKSSSEVTIYFTWLGFPYTLNITGCTDVPQLLYKKTQSIETHKHCYFLYSRQNCNGRKIKVDPKEEGHVNLAKLDFDEELASLQLCANEKSHDLSAPAPSSTIPVNKTIPSSQSKVESSLDKHRKRRSPNNDFKPATVSQSIPLEQHEKITSNSGNIMITRTQPGGTQQTVSLTQTSGNDGTVVTTSSSSGSTQVVPQGNGNNTGVLLTNIIY